MSYVSSQLLVPVFRELEGDQEAPSEEQEAEDE